MSAEEIRAAIQKIVKFTQEPTLAGCRRIVEQDDEFLRDALLNVLGDMVRRAKGEGKQDIADAFDESYQLLRRCREVGIRAAFIEKVYKEQESRPAVSQMFLGDDARLNALFTGYIEIARAPNTRQKVEIIRNNTDLLNAESEALIKDDIRTRREQGDVKMAAALTEVYDILSDFREQQTSPEPLPDQISTPAPQSVQYSAAQLMGAFADAQERNDEPEQLRLGLMALDTLGDQLTDRSRAALQRLVVDLLLKSRGGDERDTIERVIDLFKKSLTYYTRERDPGAWATLQANIICRRFYGV